MMIVFFGWKEMIVNYQIKRKSNGFAHQYQKKKGNARKWKNVESGHK